MDPALKAIHGKLVEVMVGGCTCVTKTPDPAYHHERCHYRLASEIEQLLGDLVLARCAECRSASTRDSMLALYCLDCVRKVPPEVILGGTTSL